MQVQDLGKPIDSILSNEFDSIVFEEFCSKVFERINFLKVSYEYAFEDAVNSIARTIEVTAPEKVMFTKALGSSNHSEPAQIFIQDSSPQRKYSFSYTDLCAIFFPEDAFESSADWQKTLRANLSFLSSDFANLFGKEIAVFISDKDPKPAKQVFYPRTASILKYIVSKGVPEISIGARWGSDSPYQRYMNSEHWALLSFRIGKRQQVDIAQYSEAKKIRWKCALSDLGFLENGYGKIARIKELISADIPMDGDHERMLATQADFIERSLKQISNYF